MEARGPLPGASYPSAHSGAVWGSLQPLGRRPRRGVRGRFKAAAGRGRRRRPGWLARSRQSAARGPAGAALLPVRARRRWPRAGAQPGQERAVSRQAALRGGGRRALCSVQGLEVWPAVWPVLRSPRCAAPHRAALGRRRAPAVRGLCPYHPIWRNGV